MEPWLPPWAQGVGGSNPLAPIKQLNQLGGSKWPAFYHVDTEVHTPRGLVPGSLGSESLSYGRKEFR